MLQNGYTPNDILKKGYFVDYLIKSNVDLDEIPGFNHMVTGEGLIRKKAEVSGAHNIDNFYKAIQKDADSLGLNLSDYNIRVTEHPSINGLYEIKYDIPKVNGNTNPLTPLYDVNGNLLTGPANNVKTVYDPNIFSDVQIYDMGKQVLEKEISNGNVNERVVTGIVDQIKFLGYVNALGELTNFYPVFK